MLEIVWGAGPMGNVRSDGEHICWRCVVQEVRCTTSGRTEGGLQTGIRTGANPLPDLTNNLVGYSGRPTVESECCCETWVSPSPFQRKEPLRGVAHSLSSTK